MASAALLLLLGLVRPALAQVVTPACVSGCVGGGVEVTTDGGTASAVRGTSGNLATFLVNNQGSSSGTWPLACSSSKRIWVTCGTVTPSSVTIPAAGSVDVDVSYSVPAGSSATLTLTAFGPSTDSGMILVTILSASVAATPDGGSASSRPQNGGPFSENFTITNTGQAGSAAR